MVAVGGASRTASLVDRSKRGRGGPHRARRCAGRRRTPTLHHRRDRLQPQRRHGPLPPADRRGRRRRRRRGQVPVLERVVPHRHARSTSATRTTRQEEALRLAARDGPRLPVHAGPAPSRRKRLLRRARHRLLLERLLPRKRSTSSIGSDVPFIKIASMDVTNLPLLRACGRERGARGALHRAWPRSARSSRRSRRCAQAGNEQIVLLHCVSIYPPDHESIRLRNIADAARGVRRAGGFQRPHARARRSRSPRSRWAPASSRSTSPSTRTWRVGPRDLRRPGRAAASSWRRAATCSTSLGGSQRDRHARRRWRSASSSDGASCAPATSTAGHVLAEEDLDAKRPGTGISPAELRYVSRAQTCRR